MLKDNDFDTVFFSEYLKNPTSSKDQGYRKIFQDLESVLNRNGYEARLLPYKNALVPNGQLPIRCRDYMPVHTVRRALLRFSYTPDNLKCKKYEGHEADSRWVYEQLQIGTADMAVKNENCNIFPKIVLDGGNIVRCGKKVIMADKVFLENSHLTREKITWYLGNWFEASIIWLAYDKREYLGHSDGILRYISGNKVVMVPYGDPDRNKINRNFNRAYRQVLKDNGKQVLPLDLSYIDEPKVRVWAYTNWLQLKGLIIIPSFKECPRSNERVYEQIERYTRMSHISMEMVEADERVKGGGAFNCASWTTTQDALDGIHYRILLSGKTFAKKSSRR